MGSSFEGQPRRVLVPMEAQYEDLDRSSYHSPEARSRSVGTGTSLPDHGLPVGYGLPAVSNVLTIVEVRKHLGDLVQAAFDQGTETIITRNGKPMARIVPLRPKNEEPQP